MLHITSTRTTSLAPPPFLVSVARSSSPTSPTTSQARSLPPSHSPICTPSVFISIHAIPWTPFGVAATFGEPWTGNLQMHGPECQGRFRAGAQEQPCVG
jgi:hypothetical protein